MHVAAIGLIICTLLPTIEAQTPSPTGTGRPALVLRCTSSHVAGCKEVGRETAPSESFRVPFRGAPES